jgi:hypothetical protein
MLKNFVNYFLHILNLQYFFNNETNLTLNGIHKSVITQLYYGYQICTRNYQRGDQGINLWRKFRRLPNTTKFLFKNDDKILLIKESIEISNLICDFTYKL